MFQAYSTNVEVAANTPYPLNNVVVDKGCGEVLNGTSTIQLNHRGIYLVEVDGFATPDAVSAVTAQLYVNGLPQPQAISSFVPAAVTDTRTFGFKTYVRVAQNNCNCNHYTTPTVIQIMNGDTAVSEAHINVCVGKVC